MKDCGLAPRLVAGAYDSHGQNLLGTALSPPIRVLANNDVPTGAAFIPLTIEVRCVTATDTIATVSVA